MYIYIYTYIYIYMCCEYNKKEASQEKISDYSKS